jgi:arabinoxylan arabinofuranohydrolase
MRRIFRYLMGAFLMTILSGNGASMLSNQGERNSLSIKSDKPKYEAYLFTYFTGNRPEEEQLRFAISIDGFKYYPLNNGKPVINLDSIARWKCIRDPHILRAEDGKIFYIVATDMKSSAGWSSNDGLVMLKSNDLVNWDAVGIDFPTVFPNLFTRESLTRVWAPQTIYDNEAGKFMVYYSLEYKGQQLTIFYSYANDDFTALSEPKKLVDYGQSIIDADIVKHNGTYHMVLAGIWKVTAPKLKGPWSELDKRKLQQTTKDAEGPALFKLNNSDDWILMYDCFRDGYYQFCKSSDLENFELVAQTETKGNFTPRHGTVIGITLEEAIRLNRKWGGVPDELIIK